LVDFRGDCPLKMRVPTDSIRASSFIDSDSNGRSHSGFTNSTRMGSVILQLSEEINLALYDRVLTKIRVFSTRAFVEYKPEVAALIREV
jgi:hypothetical protein